MLLTIFNEIPDHRVAKAKQYELSYILLFTVFAILSGADSYRTAQTFIAEKLPFLKEEFSLNWRKAPAHTTLRQIILGVAPEELEKAFRKYAEILAGLDPKKYAFICLDGKAVKGSFDHIKEQRMMQIFNAFLADKDIILAHEKIDDKTNEIPMAQKLVKELNMGKCIFTLDALHCQKKR